MALGNRELMQECFPKHSLMGNERMKYDKETDEEGKKRDVSMEKSKAGTKERSPDGVTLRPSLLSIPNLNTILIKIK